MASSTGFKQQCPSCEAMVTIRDPRLIGRKIDCPKCKYRFVVEEPVPEEEAEDEETPKKAGKKSASEPRNGAAGKGAVKGKSGEIKKSKKKGDEDEAEEDSGEKKTAKGKKKKTTTGDNKMKLGLALAGVGVIGLVVALYFMFFTGKKTPPKKGPPPNLQTNQDKTGTGDKPKVGDNDRNPINEKGGNLAAAGVELTNLLLPGTDHITHVHFKSVLDSDLGTVLQKLIPDGYFRKRLGFSLKSIDALIRTESSQEGWAFTLVHLMDAVNLEEVKTALGGGTARAAIKNHDYFVANGETPWLDQLGRLTLCKAGLALGPPRPGRLAFHLYNRQTLVFADEAAMQKFLEADRTPQRTTRKPVKKPKEAAKDKAAANPKKAAREGFKNNTGNTEKQGEGDKKEDLLEGAYLTVAPELGSMLAALEKPKEGQGEPLFVSATLRGAAPAGRQLWDITQWFNKEPAPIEVVGTALHYQKEPLVYLYQNVLACKDEASAKEVFTSLRDVVAPNLAEFLTAVTGVKLPVFREKPSDPMNPPPAKEEKKPGKEETGILVTQEEKKVGFDLKLFLKDKDKDRLKKITALVLKGFQGELALAEASRSPEQRKLLRSRLAFGVGALGKGKNGFPPGTLPRPAAKERSGYPWEPDKRVSWMRELLPYMDHETLYSSINPALSWDEGENLAAARTIVPEFIDPAYPAATRFVAYPGTRIGVAATHYVGLSGVGEDSAEGTADPKQAGIFGYDRATPLSGLERGASNTAVVIQVPPTYGSPWLAGGGSTVRGVPEKQSIKPFVCVSGPKGQRGTYVLMADGAVRFVSEKVADDVFKAMCRLKGPAPAQDGWELVSPPRKDLP